MWKIILVTMLIWIGSLFAVFTPGDTIPNIEFTELQFNDDDSVDSLSRDLYTILDDGRTVIIYFFTITFS